MPPSNHFGLPDLGLGIGYRNVHYGEVLEKKPKIDWFEIIPENFMDTGGRPRYFLDRLRELYPIVMHGVSMSIGSTDPLDFTYLKSLKKLADEVGVVWMGDHVCWTGTAGINGHDLYPMPYTEESLKHIVKRIKTVQDFLERPLILENPSTYVTFRHSTLSEEEFITRMADDADCGLLLDVNNVFVTCFNHDLDPMAYLARLPMNRVVQIHLAGHTDNGTHRVDTHDGPVISEVWKLYKHVMKSAGNRATLLEWDANIPSLAKTIAEVKKAAKYRESAPGAVHAS